MERTLAGRYVLERVIGEGGMATVWRARDTRLDRPVAVKVMAERFASDPEFRERFSREARAAASFSHPNVVDVLDYGEEDGAPYIVMELVEGEDLRAVLGREGRLPAEKVARIGADVAQGLAAAHRRGLVHRDIKPANILIAEDGTPKLTDFGIARALGSATQTRAGLTFGSVHYLSPEQVQGTPVDARSDIYSLGVVLYEAATGERPFDGDAPAAIAVRRLSEAPRPPHAVEPSVPHWLSSVIERAMARDPGRRYASASELQRDLTARAELAPPPAASEKTVVMPTPAAPGRPAVKITRARPVPRRGGFGAAAVFVLGLAVAAALIGSGVYLLAVPGTVSVPLVEGRSRDEAISELQAAGLRVDARCCDANPKPKNVVYRQDPRPPALLRASDTVTIYISDGPPLVAIPALKGLTLADAKRELERVGLALGTTDERFDDAAPTGRVVEVEPASGTPVPAGFRVNLTLSKGPRPTPSPSPTPTPTQAPPPTTIFTPPPTRSP